jgi:hypothetical protein
MTTLLLPINALPNHSKWPPNIGHQHSCEFEILLAHWNCWAKHYGDKLIVKTGKTTGRVPNAPSKKGEK